jgi:hypothetical protein
MYGSLIVAALCSSHSESSPSYGRRRCGQRLPSRRGSPGHGASITRFSTIGLAQPSEETESIKNP